LIRSGYSFRVAAGRIEEVLDRLVEIGWKEAPIADRCSTYSFVEWTREAEKRGLRPVYGVELAVSPEPAAPKPIYDYWSFFANGDGLRELNELVTQATMSPGREPALRYDQAVDNSLLKITGAAVLPDLLPSPREGLFFGLSPALPRASGRALLRAGHSPLARSENFYPREGDENLWRTIVRQSSSQAYPMHIMDDAALEGWLARGHGEEAAHRGLQNRGTLLAASSASLAKASILKPPRPKTLKALCQEGAKRTGTNLKDPVYKARLERELALIAEKQFEDYFHIVADMMTYARQHMIVGPARGSSCGSLACYLLGITSVDPIPFGLIFERFIDTSRKDLPDIDLDFSKDKRDMVFDYMDEKYGEERSARLGSINTLESKGALALVSSALSIYKGRTNEVAATVIKRSTGDSRAGATIADALTDTEIGRKFAKEFPAAAAILPRLEWHPYAPAQHAAGVILTDRPVTDYVAVNARTGSAMCDKYDAEVLNLLKIDALGLTQLSVFERCLELVGKPPLTSTLEAIPLDDQAAFDILNDGKFSGIFQFDRSTASSKLIEELTERFERGNHGRIDSLDDIASLTAIVRPGPLGSGYADEWLKRRSGQHEVSYSHPSLEPYLADTYGLVIYQEQVLNIGREIGGLTWDEVTALRKAMSKSLGKEYFDQFGDKWKKGAIGTAGFSKKLADETWDQLCTFGMWAFNKSHSVAYGIISYWCCWLKAHHPLEFCAATLDALQDPTRQIDLLRELDREGIRYVAVDRDNSEDRWVVKGKVLVGPLTNINGIGPAMVMKVMDARRAWAWWKGLTDGQRDLVIPRLPSAARYLGAKGWMDLLTPSSREKLEGAITPIDSLTPIQDAAIRTPGWADIVTEQTRVGDLKPGRFAMIIGRVTRLSPKNENDPQAVSKRGGYKLDGPVESLNLFVRDDTGEIFCKVGRYDFGRLGNAFIENGVDAIYAIKGNVPPDFRMLKVQDVKCLWRKGE
jgi:DNA polymerase III alpha subunit